MSTGEDASGKKAPKGRTAADRRRIQGAKHEEVQAVEVRGKRPLPKPKVPFSSDIGHMQPAKDPMLKRVTQRKPPTLSK